MLSEGFAESKYPTNFPNTFPVPTTAKNHSAKNPVNPNNLVNPVERWRLAVYSPLR